MNITVAEAILATLATPPLFSSTLVSKDAATFAYVGGDLVLSNPLLDILAEACGYFGPEAYVACLLSLGYGHLGVMQVPEDSNLATWNSFLHKILANSEKDAQAADARMGHLGIYHRFSVNGGMERFVRETTSTPETILAQTQAYLDDLSI